MDNYKYMRWFMCKFDIAVIPSFIINAKCCKNIMKAAWFLFSKCIHERKSRKVMHICTILQFNLIPARERTEKR